MSLSLRCKLNLSGIIDVAIVWYPALQTHLNKNIKQMVFDDKSAMYNIMLPRKLFSWW